MDAINWNAARFFFDLMQFVGIVAIGIYSWWISRNRDHAEALELLKGQINQNEQRINQNEQRINQKEERHASLEKQLDNQPGHEELNSLRTEMSNLRAEMSENSGLMKGLNASVLLMTEHLMNRPSR